MRRYNSPKHLISSAERRIDFLTDEREKLKAEMEWLSYCLHRNMTEISHFKKLITECEEQLKEGE